MDESILTIVKEVGVGLGSAFITAKTLLSMYTTKDNQLFDVMNAQIKDLQAHVIHCNEQNLIFTKEIASIKETLANGRHNDTAS